MIFPCLRKQNTDTALLGSQMSTLFWNGAGKANALGKHLASARSTVEGWEAQDAANRGELAKVSYINPVPDESGHIATVVTNYGTYIPTLGPLTAQAGKANGIMFAQKGFGSNAIKSSNYYVMASNEAAMRQLRALYPKIEIPRKMATYY